MDKIYFFIRIWALAEEMVSSRGAFHYIRKVRNPRYFDIREIFRLVAFHYGHLIMRNVEMSKLSMQIFRAVGEASK